MALSARSSKVSSLNPTNLYNGSELVNHANRVGIRLTSQNLLTRPPPKFRPRPKTVGLFPLKRMPNDVEYLPLSAWDRPGQGLRPDYIKDVFVPVSDRHDKRFCKLRENSRPVGLVSSLQYNTNNYVLLFCSSVI